MKMLDKVEWILNDDGPVDVLIRGVEMTGTVLELEDGKRVHGVKILVQRCDNGKQEWTPTMPCAFEITEPKELA